MTDENRANPQQDPIEGDTTIIAGHSGAQRTYLPGDIVDGAYQLTKLLGRGGMGVVFACTHLVMEQTYAIKILSGEELSQEYWSRFRAEAQALAKLDHPNIVRVYNMGVDAGQFPYFVMDLLSGQTLDEVIRKRGRLPADDTLDIFIQVADALASSHLQGIIHRDVKPSNIMLLPDKSSNMTGVKIVDFGIARLVKEGLAAQSQTKTGLVFGTPFYMSPEQCQGQKVDARTDVYSMGCALFECLTGKPPFCGENHFQTFMLHQTADPPKLNDVAPDANLPPALESAVAKMLAKRSNERYQTMGMVKHDLERIRAGKQILREGLSNTIAPGQQGTTATVVPSEAGATTITPAQRASSTIAPRAGGASTIVPTAAGASATSPGQDAEDREEVPGRMERQSLKESHEAENDRQPQKKAQIAIIAAAAVTILVAGAGYLAFKLHQGPQGVPAKKVVPAIADEASLTFSMPAPEIFVEGHFDDYYADANKLRKININYQLDPKTARGALKQSGGTPGFLFPSYFYLAAIRFGDDQPFMASGFVPIPKGKPVYVYLSAYSRDWPGIVDKFGPDDLTGLEIVSLQPRLVAEKISPWHRLKELSFFNTLVKAPANKLELDQSTMTNDDLAAVNKLPQLQSLGLCGADLTGDAILKMHQLDKIKTLKLKSISNLAPLFQGLAGRNNLEELWLVNEKIVDQELEPLTKMKNLKRLRISRSRLTPAALQYFQRMPALKHLYLDTEWTEAQNAKFVRDLPFCQFESPVDFRYWKMFPGQKVTFDRRANTSTSG